MILGPLPRPWGHSNHQARVDTVTGWVSQILRAVYEQSHSHSPMASQQLEVTLSRDYVVAFI